MEKKRSGRGRKSRTKARKPKFLSLRLQFPANKSDHEIKRSSEMPPSDVLSIHPEINQVEDRDSNDHENDVAFFFSAADDGGATSLTGILDTSTAAASVSSHINNNNSSRLDDLSPSSASLTYAYGEQVSEDRAALVRNALRNRERDSSEDKWVCYSEVVKEEEVTSSAAVDRAAQIRRPSLKLDYEEILNAWSNKGSLYIDAESSQIVPDVNNNDDDDFLSHQESNHGTISWGCNNVGVWTVPEMVGEIENGEMRMKGEDDELKMGQREASVLRYKEKRRNRLFSRTIRYQVRKLNAEKRPRFKGRFVKRS